VWIIKSKCGIMPDKRESYGKVALINEEKLAKYSQGKKKSWPPNLPAE
jgi:hypothetical protein